MYVWIRISFKRKYNQHKLFCMSKNDSTRIHCVRPVGRSVGYSICFTIRNFVIAIVQNALKLFNEFMLWRTAYGIWTRTTIFIISYETNIYYLLNVASVHFTIECVCGVRCLWADVFIQPILHKILMKLPLFIEFIHRFYWVHREEPIPLCWIYALHRL